MALAKELAGGCPDRLAFIAPIMCEMAPRGMIDRDSVQLAINFKEIGFDDSHASSLARLTFTKHYLEHVLDIFNINISNLASDADPQLLELLRMVVLARVPLANLRDLREQGTLRNKEAVLKLVKEFSESLKEDEQNIQHRLQDMLVEELDKD